MEVPMRPTDIQAIIDFNRGLANLLQSADDKGKGKLLKPATVKAFREQAAFSADHLEIIFPLA